MSIWEAVIGAGSSLLGGMLGRESVEDQQAANLASQREFAQHGLRWKVEDAKAAGLHPVYALGGAGAAFAPSPIVIDPMAQAIREMGQSVGGFFKAPANRNQEVRRVPPSSRSDSPDPLGYDVEDAAMGADYGYASGVAPTVARVKDPDTAWDSWEFQSPRITSARTGDVTTEAGPARAPWVEYQMTPQLKMKFPSGTSFSEALESLENPLMWPTLIKVNVEHYGVGWLDDFGRGMVPGYATMADVGRKIGGPIGQAVASWAEYRKSLEEAERRPARNRVTGRIRGVEPRGPSAVPGYKGSW